MELNETIARTKERARSLRKYAKPFAEAKISVATKKYIERCLERAEYNEQLAAWLTELQERREVERWISVKERLPDTNDFVLVYDGSDMFVAWYENEGMSEGWHSFDDTYDGFTPIIVWRPLPQKPEESEDN